MKSTTTATAAYESPYCGVIEIDIQELICTSTEGYSLNTNGLNDGDWQ